MIRHFGVVVVVVGSLSIVVTAEVVRQSGWEAVLLLLSTPKRIGADLLTKETKRSTVSNCKANGVGDRCRRRQQPVQCKCYATVNLSENQKYQVSYLLQLS